MRLVVALSGAAMSAILPCVLAGCGATGRSTNAPPNHELPADYRPIPAGRGPGYRLPAVSRRVARRSRVQGLRCTGARPHGYGIHLELYARRLVLRLPSGIGIAPPQRRSGAYVRGGACWYPLRTYEPTGVVVVDARPATSLGTLFDVWGQPLSGERLAAFRGAVVAYLDGRRWRGPIRAIPLDRHAEIVLEIGGYVVPHPAYRFPPGL